ncbi:MAG TPA: pyruvate kinase [Vicinamibacteria bacterium]|nr:pyruvate kinase [Vicinamibacteria bacterium]
MPARSRATKRVKAASAPAGAGPRIVDAASAQAASRLIPRVEAILDRALELERARMTEIDASALEVRRSARNLVHYLAFRQTDLRPIQEELSCLGLSSLARVEAGTQAALEAVLVALRALAGKPAPGRRPRPAIDIREGPQILQANARALLGLPAGKRAGRIMVTMPSEAAREPDLVDELLATGMDVMRINCAHDDVEAWLAMIRLLRRAERKQGRSCRVYADLAGPKLRTGPLAPAGQVMKLRPHRDIRGQVLAPARVRLLPLDAPTEAGEPAAVATVPIGGPALGEAAPGDRLHFHDTRGRERAITLLRRDGPGFLGEIEETAILETGLPLVLGRDGSPRSEGVVGPLPEVEEPLTLAAGDLLVLTRGQEPGRAAVRGSGGRVLEPARIPCTLEDVFDSVRAGEPVWFDDGRIGGDVVSAAKERIEVRITHVPSKGGKLRPEKGINLPETDLRTPALTEKDLADLESLAHHVDMVGLSFVRRPDDVLRLEQELTRLDAQHLGVVLKVETRRGFENLPRLLLTALQSPPVGVMVARGDLAVEVGFERMAEVQEQILWLCEAAHVPVIWATQVLEGLAKSGTPSRAEVTDAVMSGRAECVMLNKGPHIVEAVRFLGGLLERMEAHRSKQRPRLRRLAVSEL